MTISRHIEQFHGLPVLDFREAVQGGAELPAPASVAWKIGLDYEDQQTFADLWQLFLDSVDGEQVTAVVIGQWFTDEPDVLTGPLAAVVASADRLPALRGLFIGDITSEECEISWLQMCDITPLFEAFGQLEELVVRGAAEDWDGNGGLLLKPLRHERLRALRFESGGLPGHVVRAVGECDFPALERLELWLGVANYGGDWTTDDLAPFLDGSRLPALRHLGLQNSEYQDEIAAAVAHAPVVARLSSLALAMGTLTDEGAAALLAGQPLTHLTALDLHHHSLTEPMQQRLRDTLPSAEIDFSERWLPEYGERYVAVAE